MNALVLSHRREAASSFAPQAHPSFTVRSAAPVIRRAAALVIAALALATAGARAAAPSFSYQGVIRELDGSVPSEKNREIQFRLYDGPTSETPLWGRACSVLLDTNGLFNAAIGDASGSAIDNVPGTGLAKILADNAATTLFIGITVDNSSGEIAPRQALLAVPYAMHAADAAAASGDFEVKGQTTLSGGLDATAADAAFAKIDAKSISVEGNVTLSSSGRFSGFGVVPIGGIILWSGNANEVPDGWKLCDGQYGTPDLKGRFVVGYDSSRAEYAVNGTGGAESVAISVAQMPPHNHRNSVRTVGYAAAYNGSKEAATYDGNSKNNGHMDIWSENAGSGQPHENRPPFYALCYIMRVK